MFLSDSVRTCVLPELKVKSAHKTLRALRQANEQSGTELCRSVSAMPREQSRHPGWCVQEPFPDVQVEMVFTSVAGHLTELNFTAAHTKWRSCPPQELYTAPVIKFIPQVRWGIPSHPIPSHPNPSHPIPSHSIPSHPICAVKPWLRSIHTRRLTQVDTAQARGHIASSRQARCSRC